MDEQKYSEKDETQGFAEDVKKEANEMEDAAQSAIESALEDACSERDDYKDKYQRTFSDFNNYKKRMLKSCADAFRDGQSDVIEKLLPVLDSLDCAFEQIDETNTDKALLQGFEMVGRQMREAIDKLGVKEIPALGETFDPALHQAIQMVEPAEGSVPGKVAAVVQKGYTMGDRILRHSMVVVNKS